nr:hypothetical protein [Tanacetum cinerariifolium]
MNNVPVAAGTILDESAGTQGDLNAGTSSEKEATSQDYIMMPIWKDAFYFDTPSKDVEDGTHNEDDDKDKSEDDSSPTEVNAAGQHVNTASLEVHIGRFEVNTIDPSLNAASSSDLHSPTDMFKLGASDTLEATHVEFFSDRDAPEVDLLNPQELLKLYLVNLGWKQCRKNFCNSSSNMFRYLWICLMKRRPLEQNRLNPQALLKLYLVNLGWKQCRKNFCNSSSNMFGYLWICLMKRRPLEQNRSMIRSLMYLTVSRPDIMFAIIMANPLSNNGVNLLEDEQVQPELVPALHGFAPAVLDIPNNNNGWIKEEPEEDPEMEEEEEEEMDIEDEMDDPEIIYPYEIEEGELPPPPADSDTSFDSEHEVEADDEDGDEATVGTITHASYSVPPFSGTVYVGSESSRKMFNRANTEYSTLKRLGEMDRYLSGLSTERRSEVREHYKLKQSVSTLEDQIRGLMLEDKEEKERLKKKLRASQQEKDQIEQRPITSN